ALDYGWVMGHFGLSILILFAAVVLVWRARQDVQPIHLPAVAGEGSRPRADARHRASGILGSGMGDRALAKLARALVALGALTIFAGTAATAAGPHAGGSPGQRINRLAFDGRSTMDFVIHRHGEIALAFGILALATWWLARRREAPTIVQRPLTV